MPNVKWVRKEQREVYFLIADDRVPILPVVPAFGVAAGFFWLTWGDSRVSYCRLYTSRIPEA